MRLNKIHKIFLLSFTLLLNDAIAQDKSTFVENNLSDKNKETVTAVNEANRDKAPATAPAEDPSATGPKTPAAPAEALSSNSGANSLLIDQAKDGLANILLGNGKPASLMFDDQESGNLDRAIDSFKNNQAYSPEDAESDGTVNASANEDDKKKLEEAERLRKAEELKNQENEKSYIYLASVIYFNPKDWIVWINEKKITSKTNDPKKELFVESIRKDSAKILWKLSLSKWKIISGRKEEFAPKINSENQIEISFELRPNQTFVLSSNKVVEGKALVALLKKKEDENKKADAPAAKAAKAAIPSKQ
jgi:hypothetical protein